VYQFYDENEDVYPGFHKEKLTDGTCIPCCYNNWNTPEMKNRRNTCQGSTAPKMDVSATEKAIEEEIENDIKEMEGYVKGPEKYPLGEHRWGYLPIGVQKFLHEVNSDCQISKTNMNLKPDHTCLLRHGVERSSKQSFIACIAMTMFYDQTYKIPDPDKPGKNKKSIPLIRKFIPNAKTDVPTIQQMKQIIIDAIDIDKFITYQNGDLVTSFANPKLDMEKQVESKYIRKHVLEESRASVTEEAEPESQAKSIREDQPKFVKGELIECNFRGLDKWYKGVIVNVNRNGTYDISFNKIHDDINKYKGSELYKKITSSKRKKSKLYHVKSSIEDDESESDSDFESEEVKENYDLEFFDKVVGAFENFKRFLIDKTVYIDYTYLWDILCVANPNLFEGRGINLIVLEIPEDDTTNNVELACPSNHYSNHIYDVRKSSIILVKRDNWFEPIYAFENNSKGKPKVITTFTEYNRQLPNSLRSVFSKIIRPTLGKECKPQPSQPREYRFQSSPLLDDLLKKLHERKYKVKDQVLNFQGKVIGVIATSPKSNSGFIPCYPSSLSSLNPSGKNVPYGYVFMTDDIWRPYEETLAFLKEYYKYDDTIEPKANKDGNKNMFFKVTDDEMEDTLVIGFLTNTNQFVQISDPKPISAIKDSIPSITGNNALTADINTLTSSKVDNRRADFIKRIHLETNFYNVFRNTIRILFNDYSNSDQRKKIQDECNEKMTSYRVKLTNVIKSLKTLVGNNVEFVEHFNYKNINEDDIQSCIANKTNNCVENEMSICKILKTEDKCIISFPAKNLVTHTSNEEYYFGRMADELIRYNRIKSFIFKPQAYLSFGQLKYNLRDNEIIVLQDMLTHDFFDNLIPSDINIYAKYNTYDNAEPIISQRYSSNILLDEAINPHRVRDCLASAPAPIVSKYWKNCFPKGYKELTYKGSHFCLLYLIIDLVKKFKDETITIESIKSDLIDEYKRLTTIPDEENEDEFVINNDRNTKIMDLIKDEGQYDANQILKNTITIEHMILQDGFNPVSFDLWILMNKYQIPSILISDTEIPETNRKRNEFVCYKGNDDIYAFIIIPAMYPRKGKILPKYSVIVNQNDDEQIRISELVMTDNQCLVNIRAAIERPEYSYSIEEFFDQNIFKKPAVKKHVNKAVKRGPEKSGDAEEEEEEESEQSEPVVKANLQIEEGRRAIDELFRQESEQQIAAPSAATIVEINKGTKKTKEPKEPKGKKSKTGGSKKVRRQSNKYSKRMR
jgi:hypothetical protein